MAKNILILSLSKNETELISSKLTDVSLISTNLWHDLKNNTIDLSSFNGLIITGSEDHLSGNNFFCDVPDNLLKITKTALSMDLPILGIQLGMQVINIALKGKSPKFISLTTNELNQRRKDIFVSPGSKLTTIIGYAGLMRVGQESSYGISVTEKSNALRASCYSVDNGIVEVFESDEHNWVFGIRFNPFGPQIPPNFENLLESFLNT